MRIERFPRSRGEVRWLVVYAAVTAMAAAAARVVVSLPPGLVPVLCPFRALTGLPCPTCGTTRALAALASGRLEAALLANPLFAAAALGLVTAGAASAVRTLRGLPGWRLLASPRERFALRAGLLALVAANWIFLALRH